MKCVATCAKGLEPLLAQELKALGAHPDSEDEIGAVTFTGTWLLVWKCNLWLRTANRVLVEVGKWKGSRKERLYGGFRKLLKHWPDELFHPRSTFAIHASSAASEMQNTQQIALVCKDALVDHQRDKWGVRADVDRDDPDLRLRVRIYRNQATLLLDTSGESLDRRGYRRATTIAPMRETLAAACVLAADWNGKGPVVDLMCGSGTLLAEAGRIALGLRPSAKDRHYAFERLPSFVPEAYQELLPQKVEKKVRLYGGDIRPQALDATQENLQAARVENFLQLQESDAFDAIPPRGPGLLLLNPPHGERLDEEEGLRGDLGELFRRHYAGWKVVVLSGGVSPSRGWGMRPVRNMAVYNGNLHARILVFEPQAGDWE